MEKQTGQHAHRQQQQQQQQQASGSARPESTSGDRYVPVSCAGVYMQVCGRQ